jgi:hypothetical protein
MWFLIETKDAAGIGKDEKKRYVLNEESVKFKRCKDYLNGVEIKALGTEVHPATPSAEKPPIGKINPLHQAYEGTDSCIYCGKFIVDWVPMETCSRSLMELP